MYCCCCAFLQLIPLSRNYVDQKNTKTSTTGWANQQHHYILIAPEKCTDDPICWTTFPPQANFVRSGPVELLPAVIYFRFGRTRVRAHPSTLCTAYDPCVPCLGKIQAARGSLYSTRILSNSLPLPGACVASIFPPLGIVFDPCTHDNLQKLWYLLTVLSTPQPLHPFTGHVYRQQPARMRSSLYMHTCMLMFLQ